MTAHQLLFVLTLIALAAIVAGAIFIYLGWTPTTGLWRNTQ